jgi:serine-type D-Ala-D-Ala carboxypeptidase/endopeptidase
MAPTWEAGYSVDKLYELLSSYQLTDDIGSHFEYSNFGVSLLGIALSRRSGANYGDVVRARIAEPLAMTSTSATLTTEMKTRFAAGNGVALSPAPNMELRVFAGAGALRSTVNDLLSFLAVQLGYTKSPLASAMAAMLDVHRARGPHHWQVHLAWLSEEKNDAVLFWHNGGTLGYHSFIGFDPKSRTGVVVLSNSGSGSVDDIGMHLLNPKNGLWRPTTPLRQK